MPVEMRHRLMTEAEAEIIIGIINRAEQVVVLKCTVVKHQFPVKLRNGSRGQAQANSHR